MAKRGKNKQKQRVAFRKNRGKRSRNDNNLTREASGIADADDVEGARVEDLPSAERLSGKGDLTRSRTVIVQDADEESGVLTIEVDETNCQKGRVLSATGLNSIVQNDAGENYECTIRRVVRTMSRDARNAVVAGDIVLFQKLDDQYGVIERVDPRRSTMTT